MIGCNRNVHFAKGITKKGNTMVKENYATQNVFRFPLRKKIKAPSSTTF